MAEQFGRRFAAGTQAQGVEYDEGLRAHMLKVYNYMASGVLLTGIVAVIFSGMTFNNGQLTSLGETIYLSPLRWVIMFSPFALILAMSFGLHKMSHFALQACFWAFATLMGVSISWILAVYTGSSVAQIFFVTAAAFGSLSLYGYTTKKDLSGWGSFLIMGLFGIIIAMVVNLFLASPMMHFVISVLGVLIFAGLTAYDTQKIKAIYYQGHGEATLAKLAIMGALNLYLDFVNMFMFLLSLFGSRD